MTMHRRALHMPDRSSRPSRRSAPGGLAGRIVVEDRRSAEPVASDAGVLISRWAAVTGMPYVMHDAHGPYQEVVAPGAFTRTLSADPRVEFCANHGGLSMAHTRNGTLTLREDDRGLRYEALVDPARGDVAILLAALQRGDVADSSFRFRITRGEWDKEFETFTIREVDLDRGDVCVVSIGASPHTGDAGDAGRHGEEDPATLAALLDLSM